LTNLCKKKESFGSEKLFDTFHIEAVDPPFGAINAVQRVLITGTFILTPKDHVEIKFGNLNVTDIEAFLENKIFCRTPVATKPCTVPVIITVQGEVIQSNAKYTYLDGFEELNNYMRVRAHESFQQQLNTIAEQNENRLKGTSDSDNSLVSMNQSKHTVSLNAFGYTDIHYYAAVGDIENLKKSLEKIPLSLQSSNVNKYDNFSRTPLYYACLFNNYDIFTLLLNHGASLKSILSCKCKCVSSKYCPLKVMNDQTFLKAMSWLSQNLLQIQSTIKSKEFTTTQNSSVCLYSSIQIIDGTKNEKNGKTYWVQRNVVTIQVLTSFEFDECKVLCKKENCSDPKILATLIFHERFFINQNTNMYQATFKKKLPYTSGRPETQKEIWMEAEFYKSGKIITRVNSKRFFVCSRPNTEKKNTKKRPLEETTIQKNSKCGCCKPLPQVLVATDDLMELIHNQISTVSLTETI
jgi:hypothetical protein